MNEDESTNNTPAPEHLPGAPVMDIKPPEQRENDSDSEVSNVSERLELTEEPALDVSNETTIDQTEPQPTTVPDDTLASVSNHENSKDTQVVTDQKSTKKASTKKSAVIIIIVLALIASVVAVMLYANGNKDDETAKQANSAEETSNTQSVSQESVDSTVGEIDQALQELDGTNDFPDNELSDKTLGL
jgi:hypothetical protein